MKKAITILAIFSLLVLPVFVFAQDEGTEGGLPDTGFLSGCNQSEGGSLGACVQQIYLMSLGLGGIIAVLMIVLAGYRYITAQGNAQQVEGAKEAFGSAFIGLIIIFVAFILLNVINPDLTQFRDISNVLPLPEIEVEGEVEQSSYITVNVSLDPPVHLASPGSEVTINWTSTNASRCEGLNDLAGKGVSETQGEVSSGSLTEGMKTYRVRCFGTDPQGVQVYNDGSTILDVQ